MATWRRKQEQKQCRDTTQHADDDMMNGARSTTIAIASGKGGTGKTNVTAAFAVLAGNAVLADCAVEAPCLHMLLAPKSQTRESFYAGHKAVIRQQDCIGCGACLARCRFAAVVRISHKDAAIAADKGEATCRQCDFCNRACPKRNDDILAAMRAVSGDEREMGFWIDPIACEGCGVCIRACPVKAIDLVPFACGEWFVSETRCGPMVHARLQAGAENPDKIVALVRQEASRLARERQVDLVLIDGPSSSSCQVIASLVDVDLAVIVSEPTVSGEHGLLRIAKLAQRFRVPAMLIMNKADIAPEMNARMQSQARELGIELAGAIRYDGMINQAQIQGKAVVEITKDGAAADILQAWGRICERLSRTGPSAASVRSV